ncbi:TcpQ domain-containing protein [Paraburkholderia sp. SARCC-3016]|uniref:toxin co-regulated pilus biosynthesis Q family protein n=1 Tax=Paraburkholderia sp. SARCC-3016 TaxID=3058611 RepID=UPI002809395F|nr:TcpQ domain-containing protein [Paraburkholderia sp. SARCC-3016]MDQ7980289.1 TcpQ domain-containing protein [Paraburkholderia sp. SARCC-3016]
MAHASDAQVVVDGSERFGDTVRKSGHEVPLLRAIEEVVPPSYSVIVPNAGAWADMPVSWHSGPVVRALGEVLSADASLQAKVNTELHIVTVTANARLAHAAEHTPLSAAPALADGMSSVKSADPPAIVRAIASAAAAGGAPPDATPLPSTGSEPTSAPARPIASTPARQPAPTVSAIQVPMPAVTPTPQDDAPASPAAALPPQQMEWQMRISDGSVRNALARWASDAGWQFIWDVPTDFAVDATATVHGTLDQALRQVVEALAGSQVPIHVIMYERNRVLRVVPKGAG